MPRMQYRIKAEQIGEKRDFILSKDEVNVVMSNKVLYNGKITKLDSTEFQLIDKRSQKHNFKIADLSEIVAENFI